MDDKESTVAVKKDPGYGGITCICGKISGAEIRDFIREMEKI